MYPYIARKYWYFMVPWALLFVGIGSAKSNKTILLVFVLAWVIYTVFWVVFVARKNAQFAALRNASGGKVCIYCGTNLRHASDPSTCIACHRPNRIR